MKRLTSTLAILGLATLIATFGCSPATTKKKGDTKVPDMPPDTVSKMEDDHGHEHAEEGPHHGSLIELGKDHRYHAELVHDEKKPSVTIFVLGPVEKDKEVKQIPIDDAEIVINIKHDGKAEQFKLKAMPDTKDPKGKSSRFVSEDKELSHDLDHEGIDAHVVITIGGRSYSGKIEHHHDHDHGKHEHKKK